MTKTILLISIFLSTTVANGLVDAPWTDDWLRVRSDDGEFSIEVPAKHSFFVDEKGFSVAGTRGDLPVRKMEMLNAVSEGTLVSFERYRASKDALTRIFERDAMRPEVSENTEIRQETVRARQLISKTPQFYLIRRYFAVKDHIYVLTAASRGGETTEVTRFLGSVQLGKDNDQSALNDGTPFSRLEVKQLQIEDLTQNVRNNAKPLSSAPLQLKKPGPDEKPIVFVLRTRPWYVESARAARVKGNIMVRLTLSEDGFVEKIGFLRSLPNGLDRQAAFAALTVKFLPAEKAGIPQTVVKALEYNFDIY